MKKRILSLWLAGVMLFLALAALSACDDTPDSSVTGSALEGEGWYSNVDFKGETLKIDQSINDWPQYALPNASKYTMGPETKGEDEVQNLCYDRNLTVAATLNLKLKFNTVDVRYDGIMPYYDNLFSTNTVPDLIINEVYPVLMMALNGQLVNVQNKNAAKYGENYFNFNVKVGEDEEKCWYNFYMEGITLDESKMYAVAGDYFTDVIRKAHCLYLNTELFESKIAGPRWQNVQAFYDYVERRLWCYDDFASMIELAWEDMGTSEGIADERDVLGFLYDNNSAVLVGMIYTADIPVVVEGASGLSINTSTQKISGFTDSLLKITTSNGVYGENSHTYNFRQKFTSNEVLFVNTFTLGDLEVAAFKNMETKAAIVYPMVSRSSGEYGTYVHDSAEVGYIPVNPQNPTRFSMTSAFLQLACELSNPIVDVYFNEALKYRDNTDAAAVRVLDVIYETISSPYNDLVLTQIATLGNAEYEVQGIVVESIKAKQDKSGQLYNANLPAYELGLRTLVEKFNALP